jgi:hypothetical protein
MEELRNVILREQTEEALRVVGDAVKRGLVSGETEAHTAVVN